MNKRVYSQADVVDATTIHNKIMAGYQGWFFADGDGSGKGWKHWSDAKQKPSATNYTNDHWPDLREYDEDELYETDFRYADLTNAGLYSSYNSKTVERHVKWMKDYGIDGIFVQFFVDGHRVQAGNSRPSRNQVIQNVMNASIKYGRTFSITFDIVTAKNISFDDNIKNYWKYLVDEVKILESGRYQYHNGKPVLSIFGFNIGYNQASPIEPEKALALINWFKSEAPKKYQATLMAGAPKNWADNSTDRQKQWKPIFDEFDIISPWYVNNFQDEKGADDHLKNVIKPHLAETKRIGNEFMPLVFPGFSHYNQGKSHNDINQGYFNQAPRNGGKLYWRQFHNLIDAGCKMIYVAMYDEVDEGTAIYKLAENASQAPTTGRFVHLDHDGYKLPSDWYLRLTGEASKMIRGEIPLLKEIPIVPFPTNTGFDSQEAPTINIFKIYPNPTKTEFTVELNLNGQSDVGVSLHDLSGRVIKNKEISQSFGLGNQKVKMPVSDLGSGAYILNICINDKVSSSLVVVE